MDRILVIEDDRALLRSMKVVLEREGYEVNTAEDGVIGLELFDAEPFNLIITDLLMPNKDGIKTISHIRKTDKNIPIIAISGAGQTGALNNLSVALLVGATQTLAKPFEKSALLGTINECLQKKPQRAVV